MGPDMAGPIHGRWVSESTSAIDRRSGRTTYGLVDSWNTAGHIRHAGEYALLAFLSENLGQSVAREVDRTDDTLSKK